MFAPSPVRASAGENRPTCRWTGTVTIQRELVMTDSHNHQILRRECPSFNYMGIALESRSMTFSQVGSVGEVNGPLPSHPLPLDSTKLPRFRLAEFSSGPERTPQRPHGIMQHHPRGIDRLWRLRVYGSSESGSPRHHPCMDAGEKETPESFGIERGILQSIPRTSRKFCLQSPLVSYALLLRRI